MEVYVIGEDGGFDNPYVPRGFGVGNTPLAALEGFLKSRDPPVGIKSIKRDGDNCEGGHAFRVRATEDIPGGDLYYVKEVQAPGFKITLSPLEQTASS